MASLLLNPHLWFPSHRRRAANAAESLYSQSLLAPLKQARLTPHLSGRLTQKPFTLPNPNPLNPHNLLTSNLRLTVITAAAATPIQSSPTQALTDPQPTRAPLPRVQGLPWVPSRHRRGATAAASRRRRPPACLRARIFLCFLWVGARVGGWSAHVCARTCFVVLF
jgi:hypothetical protein